LQTLSSGHPRRLTFQFVGPGGFDARAWFASQGCGQSISCWETLCVSLLLSLVLGELSDNQDASGEYGVQGQGAGCTVLVISGGSASASPSQLALPSTARVSYTVLVISGGSASASPSQLASLSTTRVSSTPEVPRCCRSARHDPPSLKRFHCSSRTCLNVLQHTFVDCGHEPPMLKRILCFFPHMLLGGLQHTFVD